MPPAGAAFVAVDWGTTRLRAYLIDSGGDVLDRVVAVESGIQNIAPGGFAAVLDKVCGPWFADAAELPVLMAGMVGSRNGWAEASYVTLPCAAAGLAGGLLRLPGTSRPIFIVPGVDCRGADGSYDVMRGEETQAIGVDVADGLVCLPGTHSKWIEMAGGHITRFASFITGELYAALAQSFVGRLAQEPDNAAAGFAASAALSGLPGGLSRLVFQARTQVLGGDMRPEAVRPFLSSLLVEAEICGARDMFGSERTVHLVAGAPLLDSYSEILTRLGIAADVYDPETTTVTGLVRLATEAGLLQPALR